MIAMALCDDYPHSFTTNGTFSVVIHGLDIEDQPSRLTTLKAVANLQRRNPESIRMLGVRLLGRPKLPRVRF